jgi:Na+/H+ antiporter NhaC
MISSEPGAHELTFRWGWGWSFVPLLVFLATSIALFSVFRAFDMNALAMGAFVGLLAGAPFARSCEAFWQSAMRGIASPASVTIIVILFVIGMYSELIKVSGLSGGFVWLADSLGIGGAAFTVFTFLAVGSIAMSTGSSIGTMFTAFPIFFPAGVALGGSPAALAGAIISGAILGDNLAPISDTTIISASSQRYRNRTGTAEIGGVVASRMRYGLAAAALSVLVFAFIGGATSSREAAGTLLDEAANPAALWMLIPIGLLLAVAVVTRDIFKAISVGLVAGTATALAAGLIDWPDVVSVKDGTAGGFLLAGVTGIVPTVSLVIGVFAIMGVLRDAGLLRRLTTTLLNGQLGRSPAGAETAIALGSTAFTVLFGGVNSASMITFGPVADELGAKVGLHPFRRSNVMDCFAMGVSCIVPFLSAFLFIGTVLTSRYDLPPISSGELFLSTVYPLALTAVLIVSIITGWGRRFEGPDGAAVRSVNARDQ